MIARDNEGKQNMLIQKAQQHREHFQSKTEINHDKIHVYMHIYDYIAHKLVSRFLPFLYHIHYSLLNNFCYIHKHILPVENSEEQQVALNLGVRSTRMQGTDGIQIGNDPRA